jgi:hypothetical protein
LIVSGFVTSPDDQSRICSGDASEIRMALKLLTSSMVLLRAAAALQRRDTDRVRAGPGRPSAGPAG